jgi:hypothetical protein
LSLVLDVKVRLSFKYIWGQLGLIIIIPNREHIDTSLHFHSAPELFHKPKQVKEVERRATLHTHLHSELISYYDTKKKVSMMCPHLYCSLHLDTTTGLIGGLNHVFAIVIAKASIFVWSWLRPRQCSHSHLQHTTNSSLYRI